MENSLATPTGREAESTSPKRSSTRTESAFFNRDRLDDFCEKGVLGGVLAMLVFAPLATGATRESQFIVLLGLAAVVSVFWAVRLLIRTQYRALWTPFCWVVVAFAGYTIWQYTRADIESYARYELLQVLLYAFVFFAIVDNLNRQESMQLLLFALIAVGLLNSFYAIYQYFTESKQILWFAKPPEYKGRASGTYVCPNHLAGFLEMLIPVALAYMFMGRVKPVPRILLGYAGIMMIAGVAVTISRGAYVSLGLGLIAFFVVLMWNRDYRIPALVCLVLLLGAGTFFGVRSIRTQLRVEAAETQFQRRQFYWQPAVEMWKENKLFGAGPNHYDWRFRKWRHWHVQNKPLYTHNDYLNTLADYGAVGLGIILAGLGLLGWGVVKSWKFVRRGSEMGSKPSNRSAVVLGCSIGLLVLAFHSVPDFNMHIPANALVAVTLMAILTAHLRFATERYWFNPGRIGRGLGSLTVLGTGLVLAWQGSKLGFQSYYATFFTPPQTFEEQVERLETAFSFDPKNSDLSLTIGEIIRKKAWEGYDGWEELLHKAIPWFEKTIELNRWNPYGYANLGMCYHWLKEDDKAAEYFNQALALDPEGFYILALFGWHRLQVGDLEGAKVYFDRSYRYKWWDNQFAKKYLDLVERRLAEKNESR